MVKKYSNRDDPKRNMMVKYLNKQLIYENCLEN